MTRDGYSSFVGATSNLVEKCNSWVELREIEPGTKYNELSDDDYKIQPGSN